MKGVDWISLVGALGGVGGIASAVVAVWQARVATDQAKIARDSADSSRRQADAAETAVSISRSQFEADSAARDEAAAPNLVIEDALDLVRNQRYITATLVLKSGPPLASVKITTRGPDVRWLAPSVGSEESMAELMWQHISPVARMPIIVQMEWRATSPLHLTLDLECKEHDGKHRVWQRSCTATANPELPRPQIRVLDL
jgi:hypothetical protein